jgi:2-dehydro-3-deoxyphosphogluconate aldolase/(4S)-4-hydroxy-2-oxoglutarate aldolase
MADILTGTPVIPVLTIEEAEEAVPLAKALVNGGLRVLEVTLRTRTALQAIREISHAVPEAVIGAGTVLNPAQLDAARGAGARFCVSPGATPLLLRAAHDSGMPFLPGAATATEVMNLLEQGITTIKFFPAEAAGGVKLLKSLSSPLPGAVFCPTGGVTIESAPQYLALPNVICVGGTWVCPRDAIKSGDWGMIERLAREAAGLG